MPDKRKPGAKKNRLVQNLEPPVYAGSRFTEWPKSETPDSRTFQRCDY